MFGQAIGGIGIGGQLEHKGEIAGIQAQQHVRVTRPIDELRDPGVAQSLLLR
jgi:hypothetical protein